MNVNHIFQNSLYSSSGTMGIKVSTGLAMTRLSISGSLIQLMQVVPNMVTDIFFNPGKPHPFNCCS